MATWTTTQVNATYPKVLSIAQNKNTGQYMLAVVTDAADTTDARGRVFKSNNYGSTWTLLEDLFANNGTDTSHLNYATLSAGSYGTWVFYSCAISDDGKYQSFGQKAGGNNGLFYSTNYGNTTGSTDEKWKYLLLGSVVRTNPTTANGAFPAGVLQMMYSPGAYPVFFSDYVYFRAFSHLTGLTPATGSITEFGYSIGTYFTCTVPALYDNDFTTISRRVVYYISGGNLYKNIDGGSGVNINPTNWPVSNAEGGGVAVSTLGTIVVASRYANSTGGLWLSTDGGTNWTQKLVNYDVNAVDMSNDGKYIIAGPRDPTSGTGRFYVSQDFGANWTYQDLSFTGILHKLHITNNGKRAVGAGMKSGYGYFQPTTTGYITYIGPLSAAEQRAAGKTIAELIALSYSINDIVGAGYSTNELIAAGIVPDWNIDNSANHFIQSYVKDFIDISGSLLLRNNANLYVKGNTTVKGNLLLNNTNLQSDLSFNKRIFVGSDVSMNGNANITNDVSLNGLVLGCTFNDNSIPTSAFSGTVTAPTPDYTKATVIYQQKFQADTDVSLNGSTVQATNMRVNGNIEFNDGTKMNTYYDNKAFPLSTSTYDSSLNNTTFLAPIRWMAGSEGGQYLYMVTGSYLNSAGVYDASTNTGAFYRSDTYGDTWTKITIPGSNNYYTGGIDSSITGQYVIVGTHAWSTATNNIINSGNDDKFFISSDYGATWAAGLSMNGVTSNSIGNLRLAAVSMSATGQYISVMPYTQLGISVYSSNYGVSFSAKNGAFFELNFVLAGTHMSMSYDGRYLYGGKIGVIRIDLSNNGSQVLIQSGGTNKAGCSLACSKKSYLMAYFHIDLSNTVDNKVYVCTDGLTPVTRTIPTTSNSKRVYIDYNEHIYVATNDGKCFVSTDTGANWTTLSFGATISNSINYIYATPKYIFTGEGTQYSAGNGLFLPSSAAYKKYIRLTTFKASTFTGLTIKNTLTAGSYVVSSDYRIKTDVARLDNMFTVDNLRPVKYLQTLTNKQQYGFIAHELQQYYPDLVIGEKDGTDMQRVNYTGLIAILINEITQLKRELAELESKSRPAVSL